MSEVIIPTEWGRYIGSQGVIYVKPRGWSTCYPSIPILQFLIGRLWDDVALAMVSAMRPSSIRVITGSETCDSHINRVSVYVTDRLIIEGICMEVEANAPDMNGYELCMRAGLYEHSMD